MRPHRLQRTVLGLSLMSLLATSRSIAQTSAWDSVSRIVKSPSTPSAGYVRYNFPRRDVTLHIGDVTVAPALALGAWAGFGGDPSNADMMGDLVLLSAEVAPVQAEMARQGIEVAAVHNHLVGEEPRIVYLHFHAMGTATALAQKLDRVLVVTGIPRPVAPAASAALTIDTVAVFRAMGQSGRASGAVAQLSFMLVPGPVSMAGHMLVPALAYGSPINIQMVNATRAVATGDFSITADKVQPVLGALAAHGITATAMHSHLVGEAPTISYIHFWADGELPAVLSGLRAAVDAAK